jgi:hypothetical protein
MPIRGDRVEAALLEIRRRISYFSGNLHFRKISPGYHLAITFLRIAEIVSRAIILASAQAAWISRRKRSSRC